VTAKSRLLLLAASWHPPSQLFVKGDRKQVSIERIQGNLLR